MYVKHYMIFFLKKKILDNHITSFIQKVWAGSQLEKGENGEGWASQNIDHWAIIRDFIQSLKLTENQEIQRTSKITWSNSHIF